EGLGDLRSPVAKRLPVDAGLRDLDPELGAAVRDVVVELSRSEEGLGGDAGVVQAPSPGLVLLDDGRAEAELRRPDRGDVAPGAAADNDHVEGIGHRLRLYLPR